jgi:lysophospholipase L1-like esterase
MLQRGVLRPWIWIMAFYGLAACQDKITTGKRAATVAQIQRVVFLGNSITYSGQYIADIEAYYRLVHPTLQIEWINVGLPSETVSGLSEEGHAEGAFPRPDLHERLERVLKQTQPDLVFANYGMNDGIYQPFDSVRFEKFQAGMLKLHEMVLKQGAQIVHLTPPVYDEVKGGQAGYDDVLHRYSQWLLDQGETRRWLVVDIHGPMKAFLVEKKKQDPSFYLAADGVHPGDQGHWTMAREILLFLGENKAKDTESLQMILKEYPNADAVIHMVKEKQQLMRDAWLTATGHGRPGIKEGLSLENAYEKAEELEVDLDSLILGKKKRGNASASSTGPFRRIQ